MSAYFIEHGQNVLFLNEAIFYYTFVVKMISERFKQYNLNLL